MKINVNILFYVPIDKKLVLQRHGLAEKYYIGLTAGPKVGRKF